MKMFNVNSYPPIRVDNTKTFKLIRFHFECGLIFFLSLTNREEEKKCNLSEEEIKKNHNAKLLKRYTADYSNKS